MLRDSRIAALVSGWHETVGAEVRAETLTIADEGQIEPVEDDPMTLVADWDLDGLAVTIRVSRAIND